MEGRQSKGNQEVEMKKLEEYNSVCRSFSKRKGGIFKKANELVTLCGAEVGVFSYSKPSLESITNRFINQNESQGEELEGGDGNDEAEIEELNRKHNELNDRLSNMKQKHGQAWWETATLVEAIGNEEAKRHEHSLVSLHGAAKDQLKKKIFGASSAANEGNSSHT